MRRRAPTRTGSTSFWNPRGRGKTAGNQVRCFVSLFPQNRVQDKHFPVWFRLKNSLRDILNDWQFVLNGINSLTNSQKYFLEFLCPRHYIFFERLELSSMCVDSFFVKLGVGW